LQATFEDSLAEEAVAKRHCTTSEAVRAGAEAGAYRTLLTHFSQRYPKIPVVDQNFQVGWRVAREAAGSCHAAAAA
jgi:ribonuclease Z